MENINILDRTLRIVLSLGIVLVMLNMSGPLGIAAYAVFVSIYAGITGFIGWDPVISLMSKTDKKVSATHGHAHHGKLVTH